MKAESEEGEPLPEVADKLGLAELDKALRTTGLWGTLDSPGELYTCYNDGGITGLRKA